MSNPLGVVEIVLVLVVPSPQLMVAVKSVADPDGLASEKLPNVTLTGTPAVNEKEGRVEIGLSGASPTEAEPVPEAESPALSLTLTVVT
jgi:hypothetical protein